MTTARAPRVLALTVGFSMGGAEQLILATAPRLRARGFDVRALALKGRGPMMAELEAAGVPCVALGARSRLDAAVVLRLVRHLRRERIDILHTHLFLANVVGRVAGRLAGVPAIVSAHHDTDVWMGPHHRLLERLTARLADRVTACSDAVRDWAVGRIGLPAGKVTVLGNAIALPGAVDAAERARARAEIGIGTDDLAVATLGRLCEPKKGLAVLLDAAPRILDAAPRALFVIAGDGPARARLERRVAAEGLAGRVRFTGERRDIHRLLAACDLFVQPSLWEGFGLTVLEAMAMERPVVASAVGGIPAIVRDGRDGILVAAGDPAALAQAVVGLLGDPDRRAALGRSGRERAASGFDIDRLVRATAGLYDILLAGRAARGGAAGRRAA